MRDRAALPPPMRGEGAAASRGNAMPPRQGWACKQASHCCSSPIRCIHTGLQAPGDLARALPEASATSILAEGCMRHAHTGIATCHGN